MKIHMSKKPSKEELYDLYISQSKTAVEIGKIFDIKTSSIGCYLSQYGIRKRDIPDYDWTLHTKLSFDVKEAARLYFNENKTTKEISKLLNVDAVCIQKQLKQRGFILRNNSIPILGKKFGKLIVLEEINSKEFLCICDCGQEKICKKKRLLDGRNTSCGCSMIKKGKDCGSFGKIGSNNKKWKGHGEISGSFWNSIKKGAETRDLEFNIDIKYAWYLFLKQKRKCLLSGVELFFTASKKDKKYGIASLDRIDSSKGYIKRNIQWIHKSLQVMKWDKKQDEFINWCKLVAVNNI